MSSRAARNDSMQNYQDVQLAATCLRQKLPPGFLRPDCRPVGIVLGTGLSGLARLIAGGEGGGVPFADIPGFPQGGVQSHAGELLFGHVGARPVLAQAGRCHLYEGYSPAQVCMGVRLLISLGAQTVILTNAAGALNPLFETGALMCMSDMINHTGVSALTGENFAAWGERFPDMSCPFDPGLQKLACELALELGIPLARGVYIGVHGPEMETPAETRMYRQWGADAIGMSTVLEVAAARHMGARVLGISCLTNKNLPDNMLPAPLSEVIRQAEKAGKSLEKLLKRIIAAL